MSKPNYPDLLKSSKWDKEKGLIAKIVKSDTGVGKALDDVFANFNAIPWALFDEANIQTATTATLANQLVADAKAAAGKEVTAFHQSCNAASALGKKFAADFKSKPLVPKSTSEYLTKMAAAATAFYDAVTNATDPLRKKFEAHAKRFVQIEADIAELVKARTDAAGEMTKLLTAAKDTQKNAQRLLAHAKQSKDEAGGFAREGNAQMAIATATGVRRDAEEIADLVKHLEAVLDKHTQTPAAARARLSSSDPLISKPVAAKTTEIWNTYNKELADFRNIIKVVGQAATEADGFADEADSKAGVASKGAADFTKDLQELKAKIERTAGDLKMNYERLQKGPTTLDNELANAKKDKKLIPNAKRAAQLRAPDTDKQIAKVQANQKDVDSYVARFAKFPDGAKKDPLYATIDKGLKSLKTHVDMCASSCPGIKTQVENRVKAINALT